MVPGIILSRPFRREVHGLVHEKWDRVQGARSTVPKSDWSIYVCSGSLIPRGKELGAHRCSLLILSLDLPKSQVWADISF